MTELGWISFQLAVISIQLMLIAWNMKGKQ